MITQNSQIIDSSWCLIVVSLVTIQGVPDIGGVTQIIKNQTILVVGYPHFCKPPYQQSHALFILKHPNCMVPIIGKFPTKLWFLRGCSKNQGQRISKLLDLKKYVRQIKDFLVTPSISCINCNILASPENSGHFSCNFWDDWYQWIHQSPLDIGCCEENVPRRDLSAQRTPVGQWAANLRARATPTQRVEDKEIRSSMLKALIFHVCLPFLKDNLW